MFRGSSCRMAPFSREDSSVPTIIEIAENDPDRPALIFGNGEAQESYAELELRSRRISHALRGLGLKHEG